MIMKYVSGAINNQHEINKTEIDAVAKALVNAPKYALAFGLAGLVIAAIIAVTSVVAGAVIAALDITTGIGLFLYGQRENVSDVSSGQDEHDTDSDDQN